MPTMIKPSATMTPPQSTRSATSRIAPTITLRKVVKFHTRSATSPACGRLAVRTPRASATGMSPIPPTRVSSWAGWPHRSTSMPPPNSPAHCRTTSRIGVILSRMMTPRRAPVAAAWRWRRKPRKPKPTSTISPTRLVPFLRKSCRSSPTVRSTCRPD